MAEDHAHVYGPWTKWGYYGMNLDVRDQYCKMCPAVNGEQRTHVHDWGPASPDEHAPVGSGLMIRACRGCADTKRA